MKPRVLLVSALRTAHIPQCVHVLNLNVILTPACEGGDKVRRYGNTLLPDFSADDKNRWNISPNS